MRRLVPILLVACHRHAPPPPGPTSAPAGPAVQVHLGEADPEAELPAISADGRSLALPDDLPGGPRRVTVVSTGAVSGDEYVLRDETVADLNEVLSAGHFVRIGFASADQIANAIRKTGLGVTADRAVLLPGDGLRLYLHAGARWIPVAADAPLKVDAGAPFGWLPAASTDGTMLVLPVEILGRPEFVFRIETTDARGLGGEDFDVARRSFAQPVENDAQALARLNARLAGRRFTSIALTTPDEVERDHRWRAQLGNVTVEATTQNGAFAIAGGASAWSRPVTDDDTYDLKGTALVSGGILVELDHYQGMAQRTEWTVLPTSR